MGRRLGVNPSPNKEGKEKGGTSIFIPLLLEAACSKRRPRASRDPILITKVGKKREKRKKEWEGRQL